MLFPPRRKFNGRKPNGRSTQREIQGDYYAFEFLYTHRCLGAEGRVLHTTCVLVPPERAGARHANTHVHTRRLRVDRSISPAEFCRRKSPNVASSSDSTKPTVFNIITEMGHPFSEDRRPPPIARNSSVVLIMLISFFFPLFYIYCLFFFTAGVHGARSEESPPFGRSLAGWAGGHA